MTSKVAVAIAAGALAIGILVGAAGAVVVRDATAHDMAGHMGPMAGMSMMSGGSMGGGPMGGGSMSPQDHDAHHVRPGFGATR